MLKHLTICASLLALGTGSLSAQQQDAVLQRVALPGAGFDLMIATPKSPASVINLGGSPDALIVPLIGGELTLSFEDGEKMIEAIDSLRRPACAFRAESRDGKSTKPVSVYVVPQREMPANVRTASLDARPPGVGMRKAEVPGNDFAVVFVTTRTPIAWDRHERPDSLAVFYAGSELIMAVEGDVDRMFKPVGLTQMPICTFEVENKNSNPSQAASVYIVPTGEAGASSPK
jgi:hypothetical protein